MTSVKDMKCIGCPYADVLADVGIRTIEQLLERGASVADRIRIADETRSNYESVNRWVHLADLLRVKGVSQDLAEALYKLGVSTVPKLAYRQASALYGEIVTIYTARKLPNRLPSLLEIERIIATAKLMPKIVRH